MIRCIATDMDGTLLNSTSKKITDENRRAILEAQSQGIEVVISTGRSYDEVDFLLNEAGLRCPVIGVNGAETRSKEGDIITTNPMNKEEASLAAVKLLNNDVYFEVYTNKGKFTQDRDKSVSIILDIVKSANPTGNPDEALAYAKKRAERIHLIKDYHDLFTDNEYKIYKFLAFSIDQDKLTAANKELSQVENIAVSSSGHENLEITHYLAQKGIALEKFVADREISLEETMAIGDNYNDVSMFKKVGRAVAMGNANESIKAQCDFVTAKNDESGVAKAIWDVLKVKQK